MVPRRPGSSGRAPPATRTRACWLRPTGGDRTWTLPDASGTIAVSASTPLTLNDDGQPDHCGRGRLVHQRGGDVPLDALHLHERNLLLAGVAHLWCGLDDTLTGSLFRHRPVVDLSTGAVARSSTGLYGSTSSSGDLNLFSTTHATKGQITLDDQVDIGRRSPMRPPRRAPSTAHPLRRAGRGGHSPADELAAVVHVGAASGLLGGRRWCRRREW